MSDKDKLINLMLQIQYIINEEYEENENIQDAFNALAIALEEVNT
jgi:hypothetical protein